jgi:Ras-related GTP-binding protein C/D
VHSDGTPAPAVEDEKEADAEDDTEPFYPSASTSLAPATTLTYHLITPHLALLALLPTAVYETRRGLVEYNVVYFREGVQEIWAVEREARGG